MDSVLHSKLIKIQQELKAPKSQINTFGKYNYRSCEDILEAVKPLLDGTALTISDDLLLIGNRYYVKATVTLTLPGERIETTAYAREEEDKKGMDSSQITGAASSYARKYALNGLFLIDDTKDADTQDNTKQEKKGSTSAPPPKSDPAKPQGESKGTPWPSDNQFEAKKHDDLDQKQMQAAIERMLNDMHGANWPSALEEMTAFDTKDGKHVEGKRSPYDLAVKANASGNTRTSLAYIKVREEYKKWQEGGAL